MLIKFALEVEEETDVAKTAYLIGYFPCVEENNINKDIFFFSNLFLAKQFFW